jgi:hypothetical protein
MGLHAWFYRNVPYSAAIRGAELSGWKTRLTKTWLYRGTLHGVALEDLAPLLALHPGSDAFVRYYGAAFMESVTEDVMRCLEDGVYSRKEMRDIFADRYDRGVLDDIFSPWGGIFVSFARKGQVAFRDMASRDFDLIDVGLIPPFEEAFPDALRRFFTTYGPATAADAAWFTGVSRDRFKTADLSSYRSFEADGKRYYDTEEPEDLPDIPRVTLLAGFDPLIVSYADRSAVLPAEYRRAVILSSGICMPSVAVDGLVAGLWSLKKGEPTVTFFGRQPKRVRDEALAQAERVAMAIDN